MLLLLLASGAQGQTSAAEGCSTVRVYPFPLNAERPLTAQVHRLCNQSTTFLETVTAQVTGETIRIGTTCRFSPLPTISCQIGQVEIGALDAGTYTVEVVDEESSNLLFSDSLTVGRVTSVPTLPASGMAVAALALLAFGLLALRRGQAGRSRFSNRRS
ncbi:hypothetical protein [Halomonas denitrificans]|nr:hypothetical protein [Halomonas denitrificans]